MSEKKPTLDYERHPPKVPLSAGEVVRLTGLVVISPLLVLLFALGVVLLIGLFISVFGSS